MHGHTSKSLVTHLPPTWTVMPPTDLFLSAAESTRHREANIKDGGVWMIPKSMKEHYQRSGP